MSTTVDDMIFSAYYGGGQDQKAGTLECTPCGFLGSTRPHSCTTRKTQFLRHGDNCS